jgi:SAM-dependent methyltransferase
MLKINNLEWRAMPQLLKGIGAAALGIAEGKSRNDAWLAPWIPLIRERANGAPVLELGCGRGLDSLAMTSAGLQVTAIDSSPEMLDRARRKAPLARFYDQDFRSEFPVEQTGVVVASLSLHYFGWTETVDIVGRIKQVLTPGGVLICRLNSTRDIYFGARGHCEIERNFYMVHGQAKRFFDQADVQRLFCDWQVLSLDEKVTHRFRMPKIIWEVAVASTKSEEQDR